MLILSCPEWLWFLGGSPFYFQRERCIHPTWKSSLCLHFWLLSLSGLNYPAQHLIPIPNSRPSINRRNFPFLQIFAFPMFNVPASFFISRVPRTWKTSKGMDGGPIEQPQETDGPRRAQASNFTCCLSPRAVHAGLFPIIKSINAYHTKCISSSLNCLVCLNLNSLAELRWGRGESPNALLCRPSWSPLPGGQVSPQSRSPVA